MNKNALVEFLSRHSGFIRQDNIHDFVEEMPNNAYDLAGRIYNAIQEDKSITGTKKKEIEIEYSAIAGRKD